MIAGFLDSLQAHLIRGIGHFRAVERARADGVFLSRQMHQNCAIVFLSELTVLSTHEENTQVKMTCGFFAWKE